MLSWLSHFRNVVSYYIRPKYSVIVKDDFECFGSINTNTPLEQCGIKSNPQNLSDMINNIGYMVISGDVWSDSIFDNTYIESITGLRLLNRSRFDDKIERASFVCFDDKLGAGSKVSVDIKSSVSIEIDVNGENNSVKSVNISVTSQSHEEGSIYKEEALSNYSCVWSEFDRNVLVHYKKASTNFDGNKNFRIFFRKDFYSVKCIMSTYFNGKLKHLDFKLEIL